MVSPKVKCAMKFTFRSAGSWAKIPGGKKNYHLVVVVTNRLQSFSSSIRKGWEILCVISVTFPPSKNLESSLFRFVEHHHHIKANQVDVSSQYVSLKLIRICSRGARGKVLSPAEIERAMVRLIIFFTSCLVLKYICRKHPSSHPYSESP